MTEVQVRLQCPKCGEIITIWRRTGKQKKVGHIKDLYCYVCKEVTKQVEIYDYDYEEMGE